MSPPLLSTRGSNLKREEKKSDKKVGRRQTDTAMISIVPVAFVAATVQGGVSLEFHDHNNVRYQ